MANLTSEELFKFATVEFETGFTPFFKLFKVSRLFLTALVRSWLALLYTLHKLTSPCSRALHVKSGLLPKDLMTLALALPCHVREIIF
jgi:hypothetical protein